MSDSSTLTYDQPDGHGRPRVRKINHVVNMQDFKATPGYAWLVIAANPHLSATDIQALLTHAGEQHWRSTSWIGRHRWLFRKSGETAASGPKVNRDGRDADALSFIAENATHSSRQLSAMLRKVGIKRGAEWVRQHRVRAR